MEVLPTPRGPENRKAWPARPSRISPRISLAATVHENRFARDPAEGIAEYDARRRTLHAFAIRDDKLYFMINHATLTSWRPRAQALVPRADKAWSRIGALR